MRFMKDHREAIQSVVFTTAVFAFLFFFLHWWIGNPIRDFLFQYFAHPTKARVLNVFHYESDDLEPRYFIRYSYKVDGKRYVSEKRERGYLMEPYDDFAVKPETVDIEYLSFWPSMSRLRMKRPYSALDFYIKLVFQTLLYIGFFAWYWHQVRDEVRYIMQYFKATKNA